MSPKKQLTIGHLRKLIKKLPNKAIIYPAFRPEDIPNDDQPGITLEGIKLGGKERPGLCVLVSLFYLEN